MIRTILTLEKVLSYGLCLVPLLIYIYILPNLLESGIGGSIAAIFLVVIIAIIVLGGIIVRDTLIREASQMPISEINGPSRPKLLNAVQRDVIARVSQQGINVQSVYWIGQLGVPDSVKASINAKINATQRAQQIENEVAQTQAEAQKNVAEAEAKANEEIAKSISPTLVEYMKVQKWDGHTPRVTTGGGTILSLSDK